MERKERVTIKDVAQVAQVTPQTVSRALRNAPEISPETRARILKIAADLKYVKNNTAISLRRGSTKLIALVYDNLLNVYFSVMTDLLQTCLEGRGYSVMTIAVHRSNLDDEAYLNAVSHNVDGIISFLEPVEEISSCIARYRIPVLLFGRRTHVKGVDYIHTDDVEGGRIAARRLIEIGCCRFACLTEPLTLTCAYDRYLGFSEEAEAHGFAKPPIIEPSSEPLEERLESILGGEDAPDAFFCFNDMLALELLYLIEKKGLPPVKIIGYDNIQQEIHIPRRLTSVATDKTAMAARAMDILLCRIENAQEPRRADVSDVFLVNGTTA